jgi:nucleoside recognition membrane protein YjiH
MKALFGAGLVVMVLGILSFFVPVPHAEHHSADIGSVHLGVTTHNDNLLPPAVGIVMLIAGAGMVIAGRFKS